jgi:bile acid:Na+ symporter, BASS family
VRARLAARQQEPIASSIMEGNVLTKIVLPLALFVVMLGMGLSLRLGDFTRVFKQPKALALGIACQMLLLPLVALALIATLRISPALSVGLMVLALCPGGTTSNMFTYLSRGDIALSISLTAVVSLVTPFTIPPLVNLALQNLQGASHDISLPLGQTIGTLVAITLVPAAIGMAINAKKPELAARSERIVKILSLVALFAIIGALVKKEWSNLPGWFAEVGAATALLNVSTMALGFGAALAARLARPQAISIGIEVGIQNGTTALFVTSTLLANPEMSIAPAIYSLIMFGTGALFGVLVNLGRRPAAADVPAIEPERP